MTQQASTRTTKKTSRLLLDDPEGHHEIRTPLDCQRDEIIAPQPPPGPTYTVGV